MFLSFGRGSVANAGGLLTPKSYRRGYPVALLLGLSDSQATLWRVFSNVVKLERTINLNTSRNDAKAVYNFNEATVNALRPTLKEGVKSIIVVAPPRTAYAADFLSHIREHHAWLVQGASKAAFAEIAGSATTTHDVTVLTRTPQFRKIIGETTMEETENLLELLEKRLNAANAEPLVLYSLEEAENAVYSAPTSSKPKPELLIIADSYLAGNRQKGRLLRLQQIAANKGIQTRIVKADSVAGKRVLQLGGLVCILKP